MPANLETQQWPQDWETSVFIPIPKKDNAKECSNYSTSALISHANKVMLKILQARLQQYENFQKYKLDLEKAEEPESKLPTSIGSYRKQENSRKTSASLIMPKLLTVWITAKLELDMEQQTGSKLGKEYVEAVYHHPTNLTYIQSTSRELTGWMQHKLE